MLTEERKREHRKRVAAARESMPDPQATLSEMVSRSLGEYGSRVVEEWLDDRLGANNRPVIRRIGNSNRAPRIKD
jgi:hypothetical protein